MVGKHTRRKRFLRGKRKLKLVFIEKSYFNRWGETQYHESCAVQNETPVPESQL
jgi:hypothetical protein